MLAMLGSAVLVESGSDGNQSGGRECKEGQKLLPVRCSGETLAHFPLGQLWKCV